MGVTKNICLLTILILFATPVSALFINDYLFWYQSIPIPSDFSNIIADINDFNIKIDDRGIATVRISFTTRIIDNISSFDSPTPNFLIPTLDRNVSIENVKVYSNGMPVDFQKREEGTDIQFFNSDSQVINDAFFNEGIMVLRWNLVPKTNYEVEYNLNPSLNVDNTHKFAYVSSVVLPFRSLTFKNVNILLEPTFQNINSSLTFASAQQFDALEETTTLFFRGTNNLDLDLKTKTKMGDENILLFTFNYRKEGSFTKIFNKFVFDLRELIQNIVFLIGALILFLFYCRKIIKNPKEGYNYLKKKISELFKKKL